MVADDQYSDSFQSGTSDTLFFSTRQWRERDPSRSASQNIVLLRSLTMMLHTANSPSSTTAEVQNLVFVAETHDGVHKKILQNPRREKSKFSCVAVTPEDCSQECFAPMCRCITGCIEKSCCGVQNERSDKDSKKSDVLVSRLTKQHSTS